MPWGRDTIATVSRSHSVAVLDPSRSVVDQVGDPSIDAVIDMASMASPGLAEAAAGHVRLWQLGSVGYDGVDLASLARHGIPVARCPGSTSASGLAEHALMLAALVCRQYPKLEAAVEQGTRVAPTGRQLAGRTILIIGLGASGRALARRALAFRMRTIAIQRRGADARLQRGLGLSWLGGMDQLDAALARADVVSLHIPYEPATRHILSRERLRLMPPDSIVLNVSRGGLIDEPALADLVRDGHLLGAGLDTVEGEPAGPDHPLRGIAQVLITPHVAGATYETSRRRARFATHNISRIGWGMAPLYRIEPSQPVTA
jgi:phosphoglycerate dehydrogenase-like enzyme